MNTRFLRLLPVVLAVIALVLVSVACDEGNCPSGYTANVDGSCSPAAPTPTTGEDISTIAVGSNKVEDTYWLAICSATTRGSEYGNKIEATCNSMGYGMAVAP